MAFGAVGGDGLVALCAGERQVGDSVAVQVAELAAAETLTPTRLTGPLRRVVDKANGA